MILYDYVAEELFVLFAQFLLRVTLYQIQDYVASFQGCDEVDETVFQFVDGHYVFVVNPVVYLFLYVLTTEIDLPQILLICFGYCEKKADYESVSVVEIQVLIDLYEMFLDPAADPAGAAPAAF